MEVMVLRYFELWKSFFNNSLSRDLEFKANFLGGLVVDIIYYSIQFFFFSVIYSYVEAIGVFKREDVIIFLVVTFLADTCYMFFFSGNIFNLNKWMVKGDLDYFLLKPIESQFLVSFRYVKSYAILSLVILIIMLTKLLFDHPNSIGILNIISFIFSFSMGIIIWYGIDFIISSSCFWFKNFSVAGWLSHEIIKFSSRPDTIYTGLLRKILFSVVPMTLIASIPTRNLLYGPSMLYLSWQFLIAIIFLLLTRFVWRKGVLRYESASS